MILVRLKKKNFCLVPRSDVRTKLPKYLGPMTQLHAWWHILAGYATYMHILFE